MTHHHKIITPGVVVSTMMYAMCQLSLWSHGMRVHVPVNNYLSIYWSWLHHRLAVAALKHFLCRYEELGEEQVTFQMISENASKVGRTSLTCLPNLFDGFTLPWQVMQQLDEIRKNRKWVTRNKSNSCHCYSSVSLATYLMNSYDLNWIKI